MRQPARLILVRHGETDWNLARRLQGQLTDGPELPSLTTSGQQQAAVTASYLSSLRTSDLPHGFAAIYTSDLSRTMATAQIMRGILGEAIPLVADPSLRERHLGCLQGLHAEEAHRLQPAAWTTLIRGRSSDSLPGGGESPDQLKARVRNGIINLARQHPGQTVLVITHGGVLSTLYAIAHGHERGALVANCSIGEVLAEGEAFAILSWNDTSHLAAAKANGSSDNFGGGGFG